MKAPIPAEREELASKGAFTVSLVPTVTWLASRAQPARPLPCHESVLRPLTRAAFEAWAYDLDKDPDVFDSAKSVVERKTGKHKINLGADVISGHELFWNAAGGRRGSIVLLFQYSAIPGSVIFPHCEAVHVFANPSSPETPSAYRFVRRGVSRRGVIAAMFSRTNGVQWLAFHGASEPIALLFEQAKSLVGSARDAA
jgi:hypothetical protein